jgi:hypothetical protein
LSGKKPRRSISTASLSRASRFNTTARYRHGKKIVDAIAPIEIAALFRFGETPHQRLRSGDETSIQLPTEEVQEFVRLNRAGRKVRSGDQANLPHMSPQPAEGVEQPRAPLAEREHAQQEQLGLGTGRPFTEESKAQDRNQLVDRERA